MQSQYVLIAFTIKWVIETDNEVVIIKCNKCNHGGSPGGCESTKEEPERLHIVREHQGGLPEER